MARDRNEEQVSLIRIFRTESTISDILEEIALTCVLSSELPRRLVKRVRISVCIYIHLEILLHFLVVQPEYLRRMIHIRQNLEIALSNLLNFQIKITKSVRISSGK